MRSWWSSVLLRAALTAAILAASACRSAPERQRIVLGDVAIPGVALVFVAQDQGLFGAEGVDVVERRYTSGRDALRALAAGEIDVATALETAVAVQAFSTPGLRVLTTLHVSGASTRIVARADRGIREPRDLRGKRVGVPFDTNADFFLDLLLSRAGLRESEVERVDVAPQHASEALVRGDVDAVATWLPYGRDARDRIATVEIRSDTYVETSMLVTRDDVFASRRAGLAGVVRALARAERLVRDDGAVALRALREALPGPSEAELRDELHAVVPQLGVTNVQLRMLERAAEWHHRRGASPLPDLRSLLAPQLLLAVEPEAVTLLEAR